MIFPIKSLKGLIYPPKLSSKYEVGIRHRDSRTVCTSDKMISSILSVFLALNSNSTKVHTPIHSFGELIKISTSIKDELVL